MISHKLQPDIETASDDYAKRFSGDVGKFFLDVQTEITLKMIKSCPGCSSILDMGGGHGQIAMPLARKGYKVTVVGSNRFAYQDSLKALIQTRKINYINSNLLCLPYLDDQFDVVTAFRLLPHLEQWETLLKEMSRVAKKMIIIDYPDIRSFNLMYKILFTAKKAFEGNTRPFSLFSQGEILNLLKDFGWNHYSFEPEFFLPMVAHRWLDNAIISGKIESLFSSIGFTRYFGSPVIAGFTKTRSYP